MHDLMKHRGRNLCNVNNGHRSHKIHKGSAYVFQILPGPRDDPRLRYAHLQGVFVISSERQDPVFSLSLKC